MITYWTDRTSVRIVNYEGEKTAGTSFTQYRVGVWTLSMWSEEDV
jgi:hypothetical protein